MLLYLPARPRVNSSGPRVLVAAIALAAVFVPVIRAIAADATWKEKAAAQWTVEDAQQVLSQSPWTKQIRADIARRETEDQLREGGQLGQPTGFGYDGVDPKGSGYRPSINVFTGKGGDDHSVRAVPRPGSFPLGLRWESALPIRMAKLKSGDNEPLALEGEGYQIAVYGIPDSNAAKGDPRQMGEPLRKDAALKRTGKKDVRPSRIEVFRRDGGPVIFYLFPPSAEITEKDGIVQFEAHIGRIVISQNFDLSQMQYMGKLEL